MRFCFVILHYKAVEVTESCIDLLLENFGADRDISLVVVDNASPDGSGALLKTRYSGDGRVHVLLLDRNEGFARGNNAGYCYAVGKLSPDFITVMNNDVMIHDRNFLDSVSREYAENPFAVLGPDIVSAATGAHQNPFRTRPLTENQALEWRKSVSDHLRFFPVHYFYWGLKKRLAPRCSPKISPVPSDGCVLHGACLVFSRDFIKARTLAFNPGTFLFVEEDILAYECSRAGLVMRFSPSLSVSHLEDASSRTMFRLDYARTRFQYRNIVDSLGVLISLMSGDRG